MCIKINGFQQFSVSSKHSGNYTEGITSNRTFKNTSKPLKGTVGEKNYVSHENDVTSGFRR